MAVCWARSEKPRHPAASPTIPNCDQNPAVCQQVCENVVISFTSSLGKGSGTVFWDTTREIDLIGFNVVEIDTPILRAGDELEKARYELFGADAYPDATGSLRFSYGTVRGYDAEGVLIPWQTNFWGLFGRSAAFGAQPPFDLPPRWVERKDRLNLSTPYNFVCTADIIGGNSGSPVINKNAEVVGLIFDGNIQSLVLDFIFTEEQARAVAVCSQAIVEALRKVYDAGELADELTGKK